MATALGRHLVLVGFMGAGKSTLGREVAERLGRRFVDVDDEVEAAEGPIWQLFEERGEGAFRELEARFVEAALSHRQPAVIAVGGGAVETPETFADIDALVTINFEHDRYEWVAADVAGRMCLPASVGGALRASVA